MSTGGLDLLTIDGDAPLDISINGQAVVVAQGRAGKAPKDGLAEFFRTDSRP